MLSLELEGGDVSSCREEKVTFSELEDKKAGRQAQHADVGQPLPPDC